MSCNRFHKTLFLILGIMVIAILSASSSSLADSVVNSKHDLSSGNTNPDAHYKNLFMIDDGSGTGFGLEFDEVCAFCHTPHGASRDVANGTDRLLWNRTSSPPAGYTYVPYTSATMTTSMSTGKPTGVSMMCMSCHDGVTSLAVNTLMNAPGSGNPAILVDTFSIPAPGTISQGGAFNTSQINIGDAIYGSGSTIDMSNDHPISFDWPTGKPGLQEPAAGSTLRLFGVGKRLECATCHLVHDNAIPPFLAMSNAASNMCRTCHIK